MIKKILKIVGIVIVSIAIVAVLFIEFWPSLGGSVTDEDQKEYKARNSLYKKGIFHKEFQAAYAIINYSSLLIPFPLPTFSIETSFYPLA